ncbi:MAG: retroviral-like aspartic protease family protein [Oscillospiraceae bacterium]|nr:retroviral-like aspartic protease family protein [Oscillospiraceae bacterium]
MLQSIRKIAYYGKIKLVLLTMFLILSASNYAQVTETYRNNSLSGLKWQIDNNLTVYSNSIQQLSVENKNLPTGASNDISYYKVFLPIDWKGNDSFLLRFNLISSNNSQFIYQAYEIKDGKQTRKKVKVTGNPYWGLFFELYGVNGNIVTNTIWFTAEGNGYYSSNINNQGWEAQYEDFGNYGYRKADVSNLEINLQRINTYMVSIYAVNGKEGALYGYAGSIGKWSNITGIKSITIMVGSNAKVSLTDFQFSRDETRVVASSSTSSNNIKLQKIGGVYEVPVELNGVLKINFIFDSGASDVSISPDVAATLVRTGTIRDSDWLPGAYYSFADGSTAKSARFKLRSLKIGNKTVYDVTCGIANSLEAPMLLGQSVLSKFGKYSFDYRTETLTIE